MSMETSPTATPSPDENTQNLDEKATVLKDSNKRSSKPKAPKLPAKVPAARYYSPPFSRAIYNHFIGSVKYGEPALPSTKELRKLGFHTSNGKSHRRRFRTILPRFDVKVVKGSLLFSANSQEDALVHKRTGKILVPEDIVDQLIRRAHLCGNNESNAKSLDESKHKHHGTGRTLRVLDKKFSTTRREFGISKDIVRHFIFGCKCSGYPLNKSTYQWSQSKGIVKDSKDGSKTTNSSGELLVASGECNGDAPSTLARFASMVAHIPDKTCIWYDRKSIADTTDRFSKLIMVLAEMRGEMGLAVKGNVEAKQRLEAKLYCAQLLIRDHAKALQKSFVLEESTKLFQAQLRPLEEEYKKSGQTSIFKSDISGLLAHTKDNKLVLSPLIVREIDDYINLLPGKADPTIEDSAR